MSVQLQIPLLSAGALLLGTALLLQQFKTKQKLLQDLMQKNESLEKTLAHLKKETDPVEDPSKREWRRVLKFSTANNSPHQDHTIPTQKRIAVMTSGGDSCGMNACLRALVRVGIHHGAEMFVIHEGYTGLVTGGTMIQQVDWDFVGGILHRGGTVIGTARCAEFRTREGRKTAVSNLVRQKIDCLVVIGGDGSLTGADLFRREWPEHLQKLVEEKVFEPNVLQENAQLSIVGLVGSIDNDMCGTDLTIGVDTALHRILEAVDAVLSTATSHRRTFIIEVMGRNCGYLALMAAICAGASWVFLPEAPPKKGWETEIVERFNEARAAGARCCTVIMAEGAVDLEGNPITSESVRQVFAKTGQEARVTILGHVQRGGRTSVIDRNNSTLMGEEAIKTFYDPAYLGGSTLIGIQGYKVLRLPLMKCVEQTKDIARAVEMKEWEKVVELRGTIFHQTLELQKILQDTSSRFFGEPPKRKNIGIFHCGAPTPGMNTIVRVLARLGLRRGYHIFGFENGYQGLKEGKVKYLDWASVNGWAISGGVNLGTLRGGAQYIGDIAESLKKFDIHILIMIGGYDGYELMASLQKCRGLYPILNIPLICVPASISNNLPGTEASIGSDTALNNIIEAVDKIKQSSGISQRVFVIEVMGGYSGYLAVVSSLACGAEFTHTHELQLSLSELQEESKILIDRFKSGKNISLVVMNEKSNPTYNTDFVFSLLNQEAHDLFDVRKCILGHVQQGGAPSPADRILASQLGLKIFQMLDEQPDGEPEELTFMVGIVNGRTVAKDLSLFDELVEQKFRRPKESGVQNCWWFPKLCELNDQLGTEPKTITRALKDSVDDVLSRERVTPLNKSVVREKQEKKPGLYRSWTFERFDYDKDKTQSLDAS